MAADESRAGRDAEHRLLDRFSLLLAATAASVVVQSLIDVGTTATDRRGVVGNVVVTLLVGTTIALALRTSGVRRRRRQGAEVAVGLIVGVLVLSLLGALVGAWEVGDLGPTPPYAWLLLSVVAPVVVVRRLLHHETVTLQTLYGALSAYLLLGITFGFAFQTAGAIQAIPFFGQPEPTTSFIYYSLVTITTVGYGDLSAATPLGRLLSVSAAVIGQVYLVTIVAMIVGLLAQRRAR